MARGTVSSAPRAPSAGRRGIPLRPPVALALVLVGGAVCTRVDAACNLIPGTTKSFATALGATNRPFAAPGETVEVRLRTCDAASAGLLPNGTDHVVTVVFKPLVGPADRNTVVAVAPDCTELQSRLASCAARADVGAAVCKQVGAAADLAVVVREDGRHLSFRFPDTDADLAPAGDAHTFTGPATIAVTARADPLPCQLAGASCASQTGLRACVDQFFEDDGHCGRTVPHFTFPHFTALPAVNDFQADCFSESPPCNPTAPEVRLTVDSAGNLLLPLNWQGILVRQAGVPVPRLLRGTVKSPVLFQIPGQVFLASYTPEGGKLPPIFEPEADPTVPPDVITLFGSADAPYTVLRFARRRGQCSGGSNDGQPCVTDRDCPGGTCPTVCVGGTKDGMVCSRNADCPSGGTCGALFDFAPLTAGGGPVVLSRFAAGICQLPPHGDCTTAGDCPGTGNTCVSYAFEAQTPVPLEGLTATPDVFAFVASEAIDGKDGNGDGDASDSVVTLRDRDTGVAQPIGANAACGITGAPGRAVVRVAEPPFSFPAVAAEGDVVAFLESEPGEGSCDENANGAVFDSILRVFRRGPTELTAGTARAVDTAPLVEGRVYDVLSTPSRGASSLAVSHGQVLFRTPEVAAARRATARVSVDSTGTQGND